jgi:hypothetical protein
MAGAHSWVRGALGIAMEGEQTGKTVVITCPWVSYELKGNTQITYGVPWILYLLTKSTSRTGETSVL